MEGRGEEINIVSPNLYSVPEFVVSRNLKQGMAARLRRIRYSVPE